MEPLLCALDGTPGALTLDQEKISFAPNPHAHEPIHKTTNIYFENTAHIKPEQALGLLDAIVITDTHNETYTFSAFIDRNHALNKLIRQWKAHQERNILLESHHNDDHKTQITNHKKKSSERTPPASDTDPPTISESNDDIPPASDTDPPTISESNDHTLPASDSDPPTISESNDHIPPVSVSDPSTKFESNGHTPSIFDTDPPTVSEQTSPTYDDVHCSGDALRSSASLRSRSQHHHPSSKNLEQHGSLFPSQISSEGLVVATDALALLGEVQKVIGSIAVVAQSHESLTESLPEVECLCAVIERILAHRFKARQFMFFNVRPWSLVELAEEKGGFSAEMVRLARSVGATDTARLRAWLYIHLNNRSLDSEFSKLFKDQSVSSVMYTKGALLANSACCIEFIDALRPLTALTFCLGSSGGLCRKSAPLCVCDTHEEGNNADFSAAAEAAAAVARADATSRSDDAKSIPAAALVAVARADDSPVEHQGHWDAAVSSEGVIIHKTRRGLIRSKQAVVAPIMAASFSPKVRYCNEVDINESCAGDDISCIPVTTNLNEGTSSVATSEVLTSNERTLITDDPESKPRAKDESESGSEPEDWVPCAVNATHLSTLKFDGAVSSCAHAIETARHTSDQIASEDVDGGKMQPPTTWAEGVAVARAEIHALDKELLHISRPLKRETCEHTLSANAVPSADCIHKFENVEAHICLRPRVVSTTGSTVGSISGDSFNTAKSGAASSGAASDAELDASHCTENGVDKQYTYGVSNGRVDPNPILAAAALSITQPMPAIEQGRPCISENFCSSYFGSSQASRGGASAKTDGPTSKSGTGAGQLLATSVVVASYEKRRVSPMHQATVYEIRAQIGPFKCMVYRRFSDFITLVTNLRSKFPRLQLGVAMKRFTEEKLQPQPLRNSERRRRLLQSFCDDVCSTPELAHCEQVITFLWPSHERGDGNLVAPDGSEATITG